MFSKVRVVIPEEVRNHLDLEPGTQFVVVGDQHIVILKALAAPALSNFDGLIGEARRQAKRAGMTKTDVRKAVKAIKPG